MARGENAAASPTEGSKSVPPTRAVGAETATGQQIAHETGQQDIPKGQDAGSQVEIEGGDPTPDAEGPQKPRGLQAESALFVSNGSVSATDVASPTGLQPVGAVATSVDHARELVKTRREDHEAFVNRSPKAKRLDESTVNALGRAELAALGKQRGYDMPDAGTRATRAAFLHGQSADKSFGGGQVAQGSGATKGQQGNSAKGSQQARGAKVSNSQLSKTTKAAAPKGGATKGSKGKGK